MSTIWGQNNNTAFRKRHYHPLVWKSLYKLTENLTYCNSVWTPRQGERLEGYFSFINGPSNHTSETYWNVTDERRQKELCSNVAPDLNSTAEIRQVVFLSARCLYQDKKTRSFFPARTVNKTQEKMKALIQTSM